MSRSKLILCFLVGNGLVVSTSLGTPNPAQVFCLEMGYVVEGDYCVFPDGNSCELWAFFLGECGEEYVHPVPCAGAGEHRGVAVVCCDGLVELPNIYPVDYVCVLTFGYPVCSACGDGICDDWESTCNCPEDCGPCVGEGGTIPSVLDPPACCLGLELILPKRPDWFGIYGYCTALCGDGICDPEIETDYNCPEDCPCIGEGESMPAVADPLPCCTGLELIPPKKPDWYGIYGYCTALCGDGICNPDIESDYNCPVDCRKVPGFEPAPRPVPTAVR
jgi:hypothetical protein